MSSVLDPRRLTFHEENYPPSDEVPDGGGVCPHFALLEEVAQLLPGWKERLNSGPNFCGYWTWAEGEKPAEPARACHRLFKELLSSIYLAQAFVDNPVKLTSDGEVQLTFRGDPETLSGIAEDIRHRARGWRVIQHWRNIPGWKYLSNKMILSRVLDLMIRLGNEALGYARAHEGMGISLVYYMEHIKQDGCSIAPPASYSTAIAKRW